MARLAVEGERSVYYEYQPGRGLPVILVHGWGMSCRVWDTTLVGLQQAGHAVLAFDQRGCGQSDKDFETNSIEASAGDVAALAGHLGLRRAAVNGWSLGGAIAVAAAERLGNSCAGVVLTGGATPRYTQAADFPHGGPPGSTAQTVAVLREDRANFLLNLTKAVCAGPQSPAVENWPAGCRTPFRSVACGPVVSRSLVGPPGIGGVGPRINRRCGCAFVIWPMRDRDWGISAFGCCCDERAGS